MGEASGSQLQLWDYGLPTLVTRTGWYGSLPEDAAAFVRPENEVEDIQTHLRAFLKNPAVFRAMGERGRRSLKNNDPEKYVDAMARFATEALRRSPQVPALALAGRIGSDLSTWLRVSVGPRQPGDRRAMRRPTKTPITGRRACIAIGLSAAVRR